MNQFNLENQYQLYLQRVKLDEELMHPEQRKQLRQTFMGACGQMLVLFHDELPQLETNEAITKLDDMMNQVGSFFINETSQKQLV